MYIIEVKKKAMKEIKALQKKDQRRIIVALEMLAEDPFAGKKLQGEHAGSWTFRVWPFRIIYTIHQEIVTVVVLRVGHRQGIYNQ